MKKGNEILKKVMSATLLMTLTMFQFLYVATTTVQAVYEELENQNANIENTNVSFNVSYEDGTHSKQLKTTEEGVIVCSIKIEKSGVLNDGKIHIENPNFEIDVDKLDKTYVKGVEGNEIMLNQMVTGEKNINIPVKFVKKEVISSDYFDKQNTFTFTAKYKSENRTEKEIQKNIIIDTQWTNDVDTNIENEFVKFQKLDESNTLLEQKIDVETVNQVLPKQEENIELQVPVLDGIKPSKIEVLQNGKEITSQYDVDSAKLNIQYKNEINDNQIIWKTDKDVYKIIYLYQGKVEVKQITQKTTGTISTKYYGKEDGVQKNIEEDKTIKPTTEIISAETTNTEELPKQYFNVKSNKKAYIEEVATIEIPEVSQIKDFSIEVGKTYFVNSGKIQKNTFLESTYLNKEEIFNICGQDAKIQVLDQNGNLIGTIDNTTEVEGENLVIKYPENVTKAVLKFENIPEKIGEINIKNRKYFVGDVGLTTKQLEECSHIENEINIVNNGKSISAISNTAFSQSEEKVEVAINNANLGTTDINKGVELSATLKTKELSNVLYKNPVIQFVFPNQVKSVKANSIKLLYGEELQIVKAEGFNRADGKYVIKLTLNGEQLDYKNDVDQEALIVVNADIDLYKDIPSFVEPINVIVENAGQEAKIFNVQINGNAKAGVFTYSNVEGYKENENTETLGTEVKDISVSTKDNAKTIKRELTVVNNNNFDVQDAKIEGTLSNTNENKEVKLSYVSEIQELNNQAAIEYSYESAGDNWTTNVEDYSKVQRFRINIGTMAAGQTSKIAYQVNVPEQLDGGLQGYMQDTVNYNINEQSLSETNKTTVSTQELQQNNEEQNNAETKDDTNANDNQSNVEEKKDLDVEYVAKKIDNQLKDGDEVYEGETISYHVKITNNTKSTIKNVTAVATQENAIFYNNIKLMGEDAITLEQKEKIYYKEDENCKEIKKENLEIEAGKSVEFDYEFSAKKLTDTNITSGNIKVTAEGMEEKNYATLKNPIKDSKIKVSVIHNRAEGVNYGGEEYYPTFIIVKNLTNEEVKDIKLQEFISKGLTLQNSVSGEDEIEGNQDESGKSEFNISKIEANGEYTISQEFLTKKLNLDELESDENIYIKAEISGQAVTSNLLKMQIKQDKVEFDFQYNGSVEGKSVKSGDKVEFTGTLKNNGFISKKISIIGNVSETCNVDESYMIIDGQKKEFIVKDRQFAEQLTIDSKEEIKFVIRTTVDDSESDDDVESTVRIMTSKQSDVEKTVAYSLGDAQNNDGDNNDNISQISGTAWIDENEDGVRNEKESVLPEIKVQLINATNGKQVMENTTDKDGKYLFKNLPNGKYMVVFVYDKNKYKPTIYQKDGTDEKINSDVVAKEVNGQNVAVTDTLEIEDKIFENIDAGFVKNKVFDLKLDKTVTKITLINGNQNTEKKFEDSKLAKAEIHAKKLNNTTVLMEYKIKVTNEGELGGTVSEIVDYIPEDVTFDTTLNKLWYKGNDGNLYTKAFSDTTIAPGESKEVTLVLTKKMTENNLGTTYNTAEIASAYNSEGIDDIDSTPKNRQSNEDDFSEADIILSIKTGRVAVIVTIIIAIILCTIYIVFYIRKEKKGEK